MSDWTATPTETDVLDFWFGDIRDGDITDPDKRKRWFNSTPELDAEISSRFLPLYESALAGSMHTWRAHARGTLALVIVLDQFPLNMFRRSPRAFESEQSAVDTCLHAIDANHPSQLSFVECTFLYMPLMHAESEDLQAESVRRYENLVTTAPATLKTQAERTADFAREHRDVVARFGRFPHRNAVLGRANTAAESAYLDDSPARYGQ